VTPNDWRCAASYPASMQKFGLIKPKKSTKRAVLGAGAFTAPDDDEEEEALSGVNPRGKGAIVAANRALTSYVAASATATATSVEAVDASVYDYDGAIDRRDELKKSASTGASGTGTGSAGGHGNSAAADVPASSYIGGLLKTAQRRDKEKEIVHEKKLLKDRQAEDALYGDLPKFVTSAYKAKLEADEAFQRETAMTDAAAGDVSTSGMRGFYGGVLLAARGLGGSAEFSSSASTSHALDEEPPAFASNQPIAHKRVSRFVDAADDDLPLSHASHAQIAYSSAGSSHSHSEHKCALSEAQLKAQEKAVQDAETIAAERALRMMQVATARERYFERRDSALTQQV